MILRPFGVMIDGRLEIGLEVEMDDKGRIVEVRPHTGVPDQYVLSPAFVNAHSHFEYRGLLGKVKENEYFAWIKALTEIKRTQSADQVREDCLLAAAENKATGIGFVAEHSDRPFSGEALNAQSLNGTIYQEVITFGEHDDPIEKLEHVAANVASNAELFSEEVVLNPHAPWSVDPETLRKLVEPLGKISIHVAESVHENDYFQFGKGPIAEACGSVGMVHPIGARVVSFLAELGYLRDGVQFVHACDMNLNEINLIAETGVSIAHCPRSNEALNCPRAPIREMLDVGISVGLGMDSAASSGPIDMFAEMRSAIDVSQSRGRPITPEESWRMATNMGAESVGAGSWNLKSGEYVPLIKIHIGKVDQTEDIILDGAPEKVEWVTGTVHN